MKHIKPILLISLSLSLCLIYNLFKNEKLAPYKEFIPSQNNLSKNKVLITKKKIKKQGPNKEKYKNKNTSSRSKNLKPVDKVNEIENRLTEKSITYLKYLGPAFLKPYREIKSKALISSEERETYRKSLKNLNIISSADKILRSTPTGKLNGLNRKDRWQAVTYFADGLRWESNPQRQFIIQKVLKIITSNNLNKKQNKILRKSIAKDKVALMLALHKWAPDSLWNLEQHKYPNTIIKIIAYGKESINKINNNKIQ